MLPHLNGPMVCKGCPEDPHRKPDGINEAKWRKEY
jgi:hypothetical protein